MAKRLPEKISASIKNAVFKKADEFNYLESGRIESGRFIDGLVEDPEVGQVLLEYMPKERIRTYIKDGILNAYAKEFTKKSLSATTPEETIKDVYKETAYIIQGGKTTEVYVLRAENGNIFVVSGGTVLKWETALRKALDLIAKEPTLVIDGKAPFICLKLSLSGQSITSADKSHIISALDAVGVKAVFCESSL